MLGFAIGLVAALLAFGQAKPTVQEQIATHARQAQQYLESNRPDLAAKEFRAMVALDPNNLQVRGNLGVLLFFQGDYAAAAEQLRPALALQPTPWKLEALLGMCEKRLAQTSAAQLDLEKSFPQLIDEKIRRQAGMELIEIYYGAGALDKAASVVGVLRKLDPADIDVLYTANRIYSDLADESMLSIAMLAPDSARMHQVMAREAARQGNSEAAITQYRKALEIDARTPGLHFELAEALMKGPSNSSGRQEAEKEYKAALAANPLDEKSECRLGQLAERRSDLKSAQTHYSRSLELQPDDSDANLGLAKVWISTGQNEKALPLLKHAAELEPYNAVVHYHLATVYRKLGREEDAKRERAEFVKVRNMKAGLAKTYQTMRLEPAGQDAQDEAQDKEVPR